MHLEPEQRSEMLNVLIHIPQYVPCGLDGATKMIHDYASCSYHNCTILSDEGGYIYEGIKVIKEDKDYLDHYHDADVIVTHLGKTGHAINSCRKTGKPLIFISHNCNRYGAVEAHRNIGVIYNAEWTIDKLPYSNDHTICHPMCHYPDLPENDDGQYVTLINCNENKGGHILKKLAQRKVKCLGVTGYGNQIKGDYPLLKQDPDIYNILRQSKVIIMPSKSESWGRVGAEAMTMGIPVIATDTPGIRECMGDAAWYVNRDVNSYHDAINKVRGDVALKYMRAKMRARIDLLREQGKDDINNFNNFINKTFEKWSNVKQLATL